MANELVYASIIPDMLDAIKSEIETKLGEAVEIWNTKMTEFSTVVNTAEIDVTAFVTGGLTLLETFVKGKLTTALRNLLSGPLESLKIMFLASLPNGVKKTYDRMGTLATTITETLHGAVGTGVGDMEEYATALSSVDYYLRSISNAIWGVIEAQGAMNNTDFRAPDYDDDDKKKKKRRNDTYGNPPANGNPPDDEPWWKEPPEHQYGGRIAAHAATIVGERRPELFIPDVPGVIVPRIPRFFENMLTNAGGRFNSPMMGSPIVHGNMSVDSSVNIEMNPTYEDVQLPNDIFYDVVAALTASKR